MNQEKIGILIKDIRKKNNLTQEEFAKMFGVTYQAVSKWENGKNIPDISILKEISKKFNVDINDLLEGNNTKTLKIAIFLPLVISILCSLSVIIIAINHSKKDNFEFRQMKSTCSKFDLTGSMAYSKDKTSIYISSIDYCGKKDETVYKKISCNLYENYKDKKTLISSCKGKKNTTIENFLKDVKISVDSYDAMCKKFDKESLYIEITLENNSDLELTHKIPITLKDNC